MAALRWKLICGIAIKYKIKVIKSEQNWLHSMTKTLNSGPCKADQDESHCERGPHWKADQASSAIWRWSDLLWKWSQRINGDNNKGKDNDKDNHNYNDNGNDKGFVQGAEGRERKTEGSDGEGRRQRGGAEGHGRQGGDPSFSKHSATVKSFVREKSVESFVNISWYQAFN